MEKTRKLTTITLWVLMAISVVLFVVMVSSIDDEKNPGERAQQMIAMNINWSIVLFAASAAITLIFAVVQTVTDTAKLKGAGIAVGLLGLVLVVSYFGLSTGQIPSFPKAEEFVAKGILNESVSKWIGTGLYATYILFGAAILSIAGFGASSIFKRS